MEKKCLTCGQRLPDIRLGVRLTEFKTKIFDAILRAGPEGIQTLDLLEHSDLAGLSRQSLRSHVHQINDLIEESGYRIYGRGRPNRNRINRSVDDQGTWRLEKNP